LIGLLVGLGVLDYAAAKALRALRDRPASLVAGRSATGGTGLTETSPLTLEVPGGVGASGGPEAVTVAAGVSIFVAPSLIDQIELGSRDGPTAVDPFGLPDSAGPGLPVPQANRGALIARLDDDPPFAVGSRSCIFTASRAGRLRFGVNDPEPARNQGRFSVTLSIPEARSVLAATPACGTILS
jgi:hypothetical protein